MLRKLLLLAILVPFLQVNAQYRSHSFQMEDIINTLIADYPFSFENTFRLAAYTELKGRYNQRDESILLDFGALGRLTIYEKNCLLRTADHRVFHLDKYNNSSSEVASINEQLGILLDNIFLLGNHDVNPEVLDFVDTYLAKKNIEPFDKIYLRHILIHYGKYDRIKKRIEFHTDWLPDQTYSYRDEEDSLVVLKPIHAMWIKLDKEILRGYYVWSGGTVFIEDVERDVIYATGEEYEYNVVAFKAFLQKMFTQTTQYIVSEENRRLAKKFRETMDNLPTPEEGNLAVAEPIQNEFPQSQTSSLRPKVRTRAVPPAANLNGPLYSKDAWIPMMLGMLRARSINVGEADIIKYFINEPYFEKLYELLNSEEKALVDEYLR